MPPKKSANGTSPNYLLKITLCKTTSPTVTRLLSVPSDFQFVDLHFAITAAFGWDPSTDPCNFWIFRSWNEDPVKYCENLKHKGSLVIYAAAPHSGFDLKPGNLKATNKVSSRLKQEGSGKFWSYEYNSSRIHHAVEVVDIIDDKAQNGKLGCLGGQGTIARKS